MGFCNTVALSSNGIGRFGATWIIAVRVRAALPNIRERRIIVSLKQFIRINRPQLDDAIRAALHARGGLQLNDNDRAEWIISDEGLNTWARSCGVKV